MPRAQHIITTSTHDPFFFFRGWSGIRPRLTGKCASLKANQRYKKKRVALHCSTIIWNSKLTTETLLQDDCQNYIRVLAHTKEGEMLVCGTNAFNPLCRRYGRNVCFFFFTCCEWITNELTMNHHVFSFCVNYRGHVTWKWSKSFPAKGSARLIPITTAPSSLAAGSCTRGRPRISPAWTRWSTKSPSGRSSTTTRALTVCVPDDETLLWSVSR